MPLKRRSRKQKGNSGAGVKGGAMRGDYTRIEYWRRHSRTFIWVWLVELGVEAVVLGREKLASVVARFRRFDPEDPFR